MRSCPASILAWPRQYREDHDAEYVGRDTAPCPPRGRDAVGGYSRRGAASGQTLPDEFLRGGTGGLPPRTGRNRTVLTRRVLRRPAGDDRRPPRTYRRAEC